MHITASVFINDDESGLHHDYEVWLEKLALHAPIGQAGPEAGCTTAPAKLAYGKPLSWTRGQGRRCAPEADRISLGDARDGPRRAAMVAVTNDRLDFGTWERIFYGEFDGRRKRVLVKIIRE